MRCSMPQRVEVDRDLCEGHGMCEVLAPDAFYVDDEGKAVVPPSAATTDVDQLEQAANSCPVRAIVVHSDPNP